VVVWFNGSVTEVGWPAPFTVKTVWWLKGDVIVTRAPFASYPKLVVWLRGSVIDATWLNVAS
jgi:hypothetical protein